MSDKPTAVQIKGALASKYPRPEWVALCELDCSTSMPTNQRRIDFFAVNCYASKGFRSVACEVKVSRSDWINEAQHPEKRAPFQALSSEFWYVSPTGIIEKDEVPESCGLYHVTEGLTFRTVKVAPHFDLQELPLPFVASLIRKCTEPHPAVPRALWKFEGQELDAAQLQALVEQIYEDRLKYYRERSAPVEKPRDKRVDAGLDLAHHVSAQVKHSYSPDFSTPDEFDQWLLEKGVLLSDLRHRLTAFHSELGRLLALKAAEPNEADPV